MSEQQTEPTHVVSEGGIAAKHPLLQEQGALVGSATGTEFNTIKAGIVPVACWRVEDLRFEFDSSFITPGIKTEFEYLAKLVKEHPPSSKAHGKPGCPLSVFGHADPTGDDDYNKQLSGRRATAIYALLIRDTNLWEKLFSHPVGNDKWGRNTLRKMLDFVSSDDEEKPPDEKEQESASGGPAQKAGRAGGKSSGTTDEQVVQHERNVGKRKQLYAQYMEKLSGPELLLKEQDFLGHGDDSGGKGDYQGCSEFNPVTIFSQEEQKKFEQTKDKTERNAENAANRRVMLLIFRKGSRVDPSKWPCPRVTEGTAGCKKRFWSDGERRRNSRLPKERRQFEKTKDTFACRFYDRISNNSPCERPGPLRTLFRFGFAEKLCDRNPGAISLHLENRDGSQQRVFSMDEGKLTGGMRVFNYGDAVPGAKYKAYLLCGDRTLILFDEADISKIKDPGDPYNSVIHVHQRDESKAVRQSSPE